MIYFSECLCLVFTREAEPVIVNAAMDYSGIVRETISLKCTADGVPLPDITWLKDGCPLSQHIQQSSRFQVSERTIPGFRVHVPEAKESVLTIEESTEQDAGTYSCRATNEVNTTYLPVAHQVTVDGESCTHFLYNTSSCSWKSSI